MNIIAEKYKIFFAGLLFVALLFPMASPMAAGAEKAPATGAAENKDDAVAKAQRQLDFAHSLLARKYWVMAGEEYHKFLQTYPTSPLAEEAWFYLAESFYWLFAENNDVKNLDKAVAAYSSLLEKFHKTRFKYYAILHLNLSLFFQGRYDKAIEGLLVLDADRKVPEKISHALRYYLGKSYYLKKSYPESLKYFELISMSDGRFALLANYLIADIFRRMDKPDEAKKRYYLFIKKFKQDSGLVAESYLAIGKISFDQDKYPEAEKAFGEIVANFATSSQYEDAYSGFIWSLFQQRKYAETATAVDSFLAVRPKTRYILPVRYLKGMALLEQKEYGTAAATFALVAGVSAESVADKAWPEKAFCRMVWCAHYLKNSKTVIEDGKRFLSEYPKSNYTGEINYLMGNAFFTQKDYSSAIFRFQNLLKNEHYKESDFHKTALYQVAMAYMAIALEKNTKSDYISAAQNFDAFVNKYPQDELARDGLLKAGECYRQVSDDAKSELRFGQYLGKYNSGREREDVMFYRAIAQFRMNRHDDMAKTMTAMITEFPEGIRRWGAYFYLGWNQERLAVSKNNDSKIIALAIAWYDKVIKNSDSPYFERALLHRAINNYRLGQFDASADGFYQVLTESQKLKIEEKTLFWLSAFFDDKFQQLRKIDKGEDAVKYARKTIVVAKKLLELFPESVYQEATLFRLGELYRGLEQWQDAEKYYEEVLGKFPSTEYLMLINYGLGFTNKARGKYGEARRFFEPVIEKTDGYIKSLALLELADVDLAEGKFEDACRNYLRAGLPIRDAKIKPRALFGAGWCHFKLGQLKRAESMYHEIRKDFPNSPFAKKASEELKRLDGKR